MAVTQTVPARLLAALPAARQDEDTGGWRLPRAPPSAAGGAAGRVRGARGGGRSGWGFAPQPQVRARLLLLRRWVGNGASPPPTAAAMAPGPAVPNHPPHPWTACETARPRCPQAWAAPPPAPHAATQMGSRRSGPAAARWLVAVSAAPPRPEATTGGGGPTCSGRCRASRHTRASSGARGNVVRAYGGVRPTTEVDTQQLISRHRDFTCFC